MSKILVYYSQLNIGGAEKSLIRLMNAFASEGDEVTYLGRYGQGKGEYLLDNRIRRVSLSSCQPALEGGLRAYLTNLKLLLERCVSLLKLRFGPHSYDIALIGLQGLSPNVVVNNTRSKKIAVFIRTDVSQMKGNNRVIKTLRNNERMVDYYICVAQTVRNSLVKEIPEVESKAIVIYNLLNVDEMRNNLQIAPNPFSDENTKVFRILSVCRISEASKGVFRMVKVCRTLVDEGFEFRWYIVGDGPDLLALRQSIRDNHLEQEMITPGRVDNPFGYYRECDLVAMLSYYEGLCGVVNEAKVAGKAIIATEVSGVREQLEHGVNGWVVKNDLEHILDGLRYLLSNKDVVRSLSNYTYPEVILSDAKKMQEFRQLIK